MVQRQDEIRKPEGSDGLILEAWAQGFMGKSIRSYYR